MPLDKRLVLLGLNVYKISSKYIEKVRALNPQREKFRDNIPLYCVTEHKILPSEYYFQFTSESQKDWILFDLEYCHPLIQNEISELGEQDFIDKINLFDFIKTIPPQPEEWYKKSSPVPSYLLLEITYFNTYDPYSGEYDCEVEYEILKLINLNEL